MRTAFLLLAIALYAALAGCAGTAGLHPELQPLRPGSLAAAQGAAALHAGQVDLSVQLIQSLGGGFRPAIAAAAAHPEAPRGTHE